jgi:hypothetical protein
VDKETGESSEMDVTNLEPQLDDEPGLEPRLLKLP